MQTFVYTYLEVKSYQNGNVVKRFDVTSKTPAYIAKLDDGLKRNMNHHEFYTFIFDSETKLDEV